MTHCALIPASIPCCSASASPLPETVDLSGLREHKKQDYRGNDFRAKERTCSRLLVRESFLLSAEHRRYTLAFRLTTRQFSSSFAPLSGAVFRDRFIPIPSLGPRSPTTLAPTANRGRATWMNMNTDPYNLKRFIDAQCECIEQVEEELRQGQKQTIGCGSFSRG